MKKRSNLLVSSTFIALSFGFSQDSLSMKPDETLDDSTTYSDRCYCYNINCKSNGHAWYKPYGISNGTPNLESQTPLQPHKPMQFGWHYSGIPNGTPKTQFRESVLECFSEGIQYTSLAYLISNIKHAVVNEPEFSICDKNNKKLFSVNKDLFLESSSGLVIPIAYAALVLPYERLLNLKNRGKCSSEEIVKIEYIITSIMRKVSLPPMEIILSKFEEVGIVSIRHAIAHGEVKINEGIITLKNHDPKTQKLVMECQIEELDFLSYLLRITRSLIDLQEDFDKFMGLYKPYGISNGTPNLESQTPLQPHTPTQFGWHNLDDISNGTPNLKSHTPTQFRESVLECFSEGIQYTSLVYLISNIKRAVVNEPEFSICDKNNEKLFSVNKDLFLESSSGLVIPFAYAALVLPYERLKNLKNRGNCSLEEKVKIKYIIDSIMRKVSLPPMKVILSKLKEVEIVSIRDAVAHGGVKINEDIIILKNHHPKTQELVMECHIEELDFLSYLLRITRSLIDLQEDFDNFMGL